VGTDHLLDGDGALLQLDGLGFELLGRELLPRRGVVFRGRGFGRLLFLLLTLL
jgi:hypothetical protein